jgi:hypothetical protein
VCQLKLEMTAPPARYGLPQRVSNNDINSKKWVYLWLSGSKNETFISGVAAAEGMGHLGFQEVLMKWILRVKNVLDGIFSMKQAAMMDDVALEREFSIRSRSSEPLSSFRISNW